MSLKKDLKAAQDAVDKLNAYSDGHCAAKGKSATVMYSKLNAEADKAIRKLPRGLQSRIALDLLR